MNENLPNIWMLGTSYTMLFLVILQLFNLGLTLVHSLQEREGQLWRYFGAIAGVKIPDSFGQIVFFAGLTLSLWIVGLLGITGTVLWQTPLAFGFLGAIFGCRISDSLFSHILLDKAGYKPNPGLPSVPLYFVESAILFIAFFPGIRQHVFEVAVGFIIGALAFYTVIPGLRMIGRLVFQPVQPWEKGKPRPRW